MDVILRKMVQSDCRDFYDAFLEQGWHPQMEIYQRYLDEQEAGERMVFVAQCDDRPVGYICLLPKANGGPFEALSYPELEDFNVLLSHRNRGIGTKLMDRAEQSAKQYADKITLAVGLHSGYGAAQRLYIKRGYVLDGSGVWYRKKPLEPYMSCMNDDDLVLYFCKELKT